MGLQGKAAIAGFAEFKPRKMPAHVHEHTTLEQVAQLTSMALADAGIHASEVDGVVSTAIVEAGGTFLPATVSEYLGTRLGFAETIDLGGASSVSGVWRAAAAIELGMAETVVVVIPAGYAPLPPEPDYVKMQQISTLGSSSGVWGSPQAEFEIPYGFVAQNAGYGMIAQRYAELYGYDERAMAKLVVDQRFNACANPDAIFYGKPVTIEDVLASKMVAPPLRMLEIVMPVVGGGAVVLTSRERAARCKHRPAFVTGAGEYLAIKTPAYADDMLVTPVGPASDKAFKMAGLKPSDMDCAQMYDCYTITTMLTMEDAGFCGKGEGQKFIMENDTTYKGNFPVNTHGGQLGFGQAGTAGGMSQVVEAVRQIQGRADQRQLKRCDNVYVSGTGGVMSEQSAVILQGE